MDKENKKSEIFAPFKWHLISDVYNHFPKKGKKKLGGLGRKEEEEEEEEKDERRAIKEMEQ